MSEIFGTIKDHRGFSLNIKQDIVMIEFTLSDVTSSDQQTKRGSRYLDWPAEGSVVVVVEVAPPCRHILPQLLLVQVVVQVEVQAHSQAGKVYCMI